MAQITVPSIDQSFVGDWTEQDINLYNKLPFYLANIQAKHKKWWATWTKAVGKLKWEANQGKTLRAVRKEPSPHIRTFAFPNELDVMPTRDVIGHREMTAETVVRWQDFESLMFSFVPDFRDFMKNHVGFAAKDINEKILRFNDVFIRSEIWHKSPYVFVPGAATELQSAPVGPGNNTYTAAGSKNAEWAKAILPSGNPNGLSVAALGRLVSIASEDLGIPYFSGGDMPKENEGLDGKFLLICSPEAYRSWTFDPYVLTNRPLSMNLVSDTFKGSPFNDLVVRLERFPIRIAAADASGNVTFPGPETFESNSSAVNYGQTVPNPAYSGTNSAEYEVAFLVGGDGYSAIDVGMPPSAFTSGYEPSNFKKMKWNGEITITKDFLVPALDAGGLTRYESNKYGRHLQLIGTLACGVLGYNTRNVIPIIFKRFRGPSN